MQRKTGNFLIGKGQGADAVGANIEAAFAATVAHILCKWGKLCQSFGVFICFKQNAKLRGILCGDGIEHLRNLFSGGSADQLPAGINTAQSGNKGKATAPGRMSRPGEYKVQKLIPLMLPIYISGESETQRVF